MARRRGRGLGSAVVRALIREAAARRVPVPLSVVPDNARALVFYQRPAFRVLGQDEPFIRLKREGPRQQAF